MTNNKTRLVLKTIKKVKNWNKYILDYAGLTKKKEIVYEMRSGIKYLTRSGTFDRGILTAIAISDEHKIETLKLPKDAIVVDIGAQAGYFSLYVSKKAKKIFGYEPVTENYEQFLKNIELNKLGNKIKAINFAISDKTETFKLFLSKDNSGGHSRYFKSKNSITVKAIPMKDIFKQNKISKCDLIKIDIEGSEYKILYSLPKEYFKKIDRLIVECHFVDNKTGNKFALKKYLEKKGYSIKMEEDTLFCKFKKF